MKGYIATVKKIVGKVLLDYIPLVAAAYNEFVDAVVAVGLQNVPENWLASHFHHRLGSQMRLLSEACSQAAGQDYGFHGLAALTVVHLNPERN